MNIKNIVGIICHDAGGAEIISSYVVEKNINAIYSLSGPAINIFNRKVGEFENHDLEFVIKKSSWIICGTSWQSDVEWRAIQIANKLQKKVVSFLDHWVNYPERFTRNDKMVFPDEYWVGDVYAQQIAENYFEKRKVKFVDNSYFKEIRVNISNTSAVISANSILYVCEPIREHAYLQHKDENYWGYTEEDALKYFLSKTEHALFKGKNIVIRPHPSEDCTKYLWIYGYYDGKIEINNDSTLLHQILSSDIVVGCESMAMVIALMAKKQVISSIPKGGRVCSLPYKEIEKMRDYI
jgi:hypothetical protein